MGVVSITSRGPSKIYSLYAFCVWLMIGDQHFPRIKGRSQLLDFKMRKCIAAVERACVMCSLHGDSHVCVLLNHMCVMVCISLQ